MEYFIGRPLKGRKLVAVKDFLNQLGLSFEENIETTVIVTENGSVIATASRERNVLKCIGVSPDYQGGGLSASVLTEIVKDAYKSGYSHLFLFTSPKNVTIFSEPGFYEIAGTADAVLMENKKNGIKAFMEAIPKYNINGSVGVIVANCNPFTKGHLYLMEQAAASCGLLRVFVLSDESSQFPAADRLMLVKEGTAHIKNISVHNAGDYMVSSATFPQYFLKERDDIGKISCELDLAIFGEHFVPYLNVDVRFVGEEPYCKVTSAYNMHMKRILPSYGVKVVELKRKEIGGIVVSASRVRKLLRSDGLEAVKELVPQITYDYLKGR